MAAVDLWIAVGAAVGGAFRFWLSTAMANLTGTAFPWGTLLINGTGSFAITFFSALTVRTGQFAVGAHVTDFATLGVCGGYTTFSSFSLQTLELAQGGERLRAISYVGLTAMLCLFGAWAGSMVGAALS